MPVFFTDRLFKGEIEDYRVELPCDIVYINQVLINDIPVRQATDTFHNHYECMCVDNRPYTFTSRDLTITMENGYLFSSLKCGKVQISYKGILTDDQGYPMIPDNRAFINALEKYAENKHIRMLWQNGRVKDNIYMEAQQEYVWAVGQCETAMRMLDLPKVEALFNSWRTLLTHSNHFSTRFAHLGAKELIKKH